MSVAIWRFWALVLALLLPTAVGAAELERVRLGLQEQATRMVVETTRSLAATVARPAPDRLELTVPASLAATPSLPSGMGLVRSVVAEPLANGRTRLHVELAVPGRVARAFALAPGSTGLHRYVIDIERDPTPPPTVAAPQPRRETAAPAARVAAAAPRRPPVRRPGPAAVVEAVAEPAPRPIVVLDPGHGGVDPGAIGPSGLMEKDVVLAVARLLRDRLVEADRIDVVMTRDADRGMTLARRLAIAAEAKADLLLSLHADSLPQEPRLLGASVYTLSQQPSDPEAARKAREENAADERLQVITGQEDETVRAILTSIMRTSTTHRSVRAADEVTTNLRRVTPMINRERRSANFVVLRSLHTPSVLVELGYLSNREDEARLADEAQRARLADALFHAVTSYFGME